MRALILALLLCAPPARAGVTLKLTINFPEKEAIGWINTVDMHPVKKKQPAVHAAAWNNGLHSIKATFMSVPAGYVYRVDVGDGRSIRFVGRLNFMNGPTGTITRVINAKPDVAVKRKGVVH